MSLASRESSRIMGLEFPNKGGFQRFAVIKASCALKVCQELGGGAVRGGALPDFVACLPLELCFANSLAELSATSLEGCLDKMSFAYFCWVLF